MPLDVARQLSQRAGTSYSSMASLIRAIARSGSVMSRVLRHRTQVIWPVRSEQTELP